MSGCLLIPLVISCVIPSLMSYNLSAAQLSLSLSRQIGLQCGGVSGSGPDQPSATEITSTSGEQKTCPVCLLELRGRPVARQTVVVVVGCDCVTV